MCVQENPEPCAVLGVFGLGPGTQRSELDAEFSKFAADGKLERCDLIMDRQTQRSRGFGFVYFKVRSLRVRSYVSDVLWWWWCV